MHQLRALIREHRRLAMALLLLAFCIKAVIPAGFMISASGNKVLSVTICADASGGLKQLQLVIPGKELGSDHTDGAKKEGHCAFSGLAKVSVGGADSTLLTLAIAFILLLWLAPASRLPFREFAHLRPPLRGPPAAA